MEKNNKELRAYEFDLRAEQNEEHGSHIVGRPIVYESETDICGCFREIIDRGALDSTDLRDVRFLVNHNTDMIPLARSRRNNANSTMQIEIDANGMSIRVDLDTEKNSKAAALYSATERGDISGMSFMFSVDGERWEGLETDYPTRHITSIGRVYEVSAVTFPAYEATTLSARSTEALENARAALEREQRAQEQLAALNERKKNLLSKLGGN